MGTQKAELNTTKEFAERVSKYMGMQNLKVADLVRETGKTGKPIHRDTFYKILREETCVTLKTAKRIALALDVPVSLLVD